MRAAVEAASDWGTYVMVHAYTPRSIERAIRAGVRCIEHGHLADDATAALMAENGTWWSLQPFLADEDASPLSDPNAQGKYELVTAGTDRAYELARRHDVKLAWGSDILFDAAVAARQGRLLAKMTRWFTPLEVLTMATSTNAALLAPSSERNPYRQLGVVEPGALADLLLVDGDPSVNLEVLADPDRNLITVIKDGVVYHDRTT